MDETSPRLTEFHGVGVADGAIKYSGSLAKTILSTSPAFVLDSQEKTLHGFPLPTMDPNQPANLLCRMFNLLSPPATEPYQDPFQTTSVPVRLPINLGSAACIHKASMLSYRA